MIKKILPFLVFVITLTTVNAQIKIRPGFRLGINQSKVSNLEGSKGLTGVNGGLFVNAHFTNFYELQLETTMSYQGDKYRVSRTIQDQNNIYSEGYNVNLELLYFNLAIANKLFPIKDLGLNFILGPSIDLLINSNQSDILPIDISFFGGIGYDFPFGLGLDLRYRQGILDIREDFYDDYEDYNYVDETLLNGVLQLTASYKLNF